MNENVQHSGLEEQYLQLLGTDINITTLLSAPCAYRIWYTSPSLYIVLQNTYIMYMTTHKLYCQFKKEMNKQSNNTVAQKGVILVFSHNSYRSLME